MIIGFTRVWNEKDIIQEVIERNRHHFDELIVIDKGSTDGTWEILKSLNLNYLFRIDIGEDREAEDRKIGYRMAWMLGADWVFQFDSDEVLDPLNYPLQTILSQLPEEIDAVYFQLIDFFWNPSDPEPFIVNGNYSVVEHRKYIVKGHRWICRFCRPKPYIDYGSSVQRAKKPVFLYDVILRHYSRCLNPTDTKNKVQRWLDIREARERDGIDTSYAEKHATLEYFNWDPGILHPASKLRENRYFVDCWNEEWVRPRATWFSDIVDTQSSRIDTTDKRPLLSSLIKKCQSGVMQHETTPLCSLFREEGSDKGNSLHNYSALYYEILQQHTFTVRAVFELGIGTTDPSIPCSMGKDGTPGASLRAWKRFFPEALIIGADIDKQILFEEDRIRTAYCDQRDTESISALWREFEGVYFDLMIDDGLHEFSANNTFLQASFERLKEGGIYIIEDIDSSQYEQAKTCMECLRPHCKEIYYVQVPIASNKPDNNLLIIVK